MCSSSRPSSAALVTNRQRRKNRDLAPSSPRSFERGRKERSKTGGWPRPRSRPTISLSYGLTLHSGHALDDGLEIDRMHREPKGERGSSAELTLDADVATQELRQAFRDG